MTKWEYQYGDNWPSENINTGTHDQVRMETQGYMTKCEYQHEDTWQNENSNTVIHDQGWYKQGDTLPRDTWPIMNINMGTQKQVRKSTGDPWPSVSTQGHMTKWEYQNGDIWLNVDNSKAICDQVLIWRYMANFEYQNEDTWSAMTLTWGYLMTWK